jgi:polyhydroxyalkanoate synthesis regulator phasin
LTDDAARSKSAHPKRADEEDYLMAEAKARLSFKDVRASVRRMQNEGEKLVARLRREARVLSTRSRRDTVNGLLTDARKLQVDLRKRAEKAIRDIEARRTRILATLEEQVTRVVESVVKTLNVASADDLAEIKKRIGDLERRLDALAKEKAA